MIQLVTAIKSRPCETSTEGTSKNNFIFQQTPHIAYTVTHCPSRRTPLTLSVFLTSLSAYIYPLIYKILDPALNRSRNIISSSPEHSHTT